VANVLSTNQRELVLVGDRRQGLDVEHVARRVADLSPKNRLGLRPDRPPPTRPGSSGSTQVTSTFILRRRLLELVDRAAVEREDETMWSPGSRSVNRAAAWAAMPLANATPPAPPSRLAHPFLETPATVGFMMRE
jgi:hypothetical protein